MLTLKTNNWWSRFTERLKNKSSGPSRHGLPDFGEDGLLADPIELPHGTDGDTPDKPPGALARWSKRDQTLAKLQEGYERVTQLVEEVHKHLVNQGERTERICLSLEQVARSLNDQPQVSKQQVQTLQTIAGQLEQTNAGTQKLVETMGELPKVARTQGEALSGIKRQLDMSGEQNLITSQTLEKLGTAIGSLGEFSNSQSSALREMQQATSQQNELLSGLIAKQSKRFTMLFIVTIILAAGAITAAIASLMTTRI